MTIVLEDRQHRQANVMLCKWMNLVWSNCQLTIREILREGEDPIKKPKNESRYSKFCFPAYDGGSKITLTWSLCIDLWDSSWGSHSTFLKSIITKTKYGFMIMTWILQSSHHNRKVVFQGCTSVKVMLTASYCLKVLWRWRERVRRKNLNFRTVVNAPRQRYRSFGTCSSWLLQKKSGDGELSRRDKTKIGRWTTEDSRRSIFYMFPVVERFSVAFTCLMVQ